MCYATYRNSKEIIYERLLLLPRVEHIRREVKLGQREVDHRIELLAHVPLPDLEALQVHHEDARHLPQLQLFERLYVHLAARTVPLVLGTELLRHCEAPQAVDERQLRTGLVGQAVLVHRAVFVNALLARC